MRARLLCGAAALLTGCTTAVRRGEVASVASDGPCALDSYDRDWIDGGLAAWNELAVPALKLAEEPVPLLIFFDRVCEYRVAGLNASVALKETAFSSRRHQRHIALPNGNRVVPAPLALTSQAGVDSTPFVTMALATLWRDNPKWSSENDWPLFLRRSLVHELTHTRQLPFFSHRLDDLRTQLNLTTIDDDIIQQEFGESDRFKSSVKRETRLLFAAATTRDTVERVVLARNAIRLIQARRAIHFAGELAPWAALEQLFLDMEGVAQWAAFETVRRETHWSARYALRSVRDSDYWSQDEGLALYLVLDAMVPNWQARMFSPNPPTSLALLERVLGVAPLIRMGPGTD